MKKSIPLFVLFLAIPLLSMDHPIRMKLVKKSGNQFVLQVSVPNGFGIQRDAPNRIFVSGKGVKVIKADLSFSGPIHHKKKEYYENLNDMSLTLEGKGTLQINARIYYCDFNKNICIPGKVQVEEKIN